jgi:hypothetical protein
MTTAPVFNSLSGLRDAIARYMNRTDLGPDIPGFIAIAESRIALDLRHWQMVKPLALTALAANGYVRVPDDWLEWDRVTVGQRLMEYATPEQFWQSAGPPDSFNRRNDQYTMEGGMLVVAAPSTDPNATDIDVQATYYARIPPLNDTDPAGWLLTQFPMVYLYASLVSACEFVKDDGRAQGWAAQYQAAAQALNCGSTKALTSGSPLRQRAR